MREINSSYMARDKPTKESYYARILRINEKESSVEHAKTSLIHFENFCKDIYKKDSEKVIDDLKVLAKKDSVNVAEFLDDLINYLSNLKKINRKTKERTGDKIAGITVKGYFSDVKGYLRHHRIKINNDEIKEFVTFPKSRKERTEPIKLEDIQLLVEKADSTRTIFYKLMATSGIRLAELLQLQKHHFDLNQYPARINISSAIAKNGNGRITFTTKEVSEDLKLILLNLEHDDLVFNKSKTLGRAKLTEETYFSRLRVKCNIAEYDPSGKKHRVRIHKLRKWFNSTVTLAGMSTEIRQTLTGWDSFEGTYHEYTIQELADEYLKIENHLLVSPEWRAKYEIEQKDKKLAEIQDLKKKVDSLDDLALVFGKGLWQDARKIEILKEVQGIKLNQKQKMNLEELLSENWFDTESPVVTSLLKQFLSKDDSNE